MRNLRRSYLSLFSILPHLLRVWLFLTLILILANVHTSAQFESYGLIGRTVYSLALYGGRIYAGTDDGVYRRLIGLTTNEWTFIGLKGKHVRSVYPHSFGPIGYAVTVGIERMPGDVDSTLVYCTRYNDTSWVAADSGVDRRDIAVIRSIDGFPSPEICGETFAGGGGRVYRGLSGVWEKIFDIGIGVVNVVKANPASVTVMAGGETGIFAPYITRSRDKGNSWTTAYPNLGGDNACNSLAFDPADTSVVYAGMEGSVIKSTDGGNSWVQTSLAETGFYFKALAIDQFTGTVFAAGGSSLAVLRLYSSNDGGKTWSLIIPTLPVDAALCMTIIPTAIPELNVLLIGEVSAGVLGYQIPITSVEEDQTPATCKLENNYPNPFNPLTTIRYTLGGPRPVYVRIIVCDMLGRQVKTLVSTLHGPGTYETVWNGTDDAGFQVASGTYVTRMFAGNNVSSHTFLLLR